MATLPPWSSSPGANTHQLRPTAAGKEGHISPVCCLPQKKKTKFLFFWVSENDIPFHRRFLTYPPSGGLGSNIGIKPRNASGCLFKRHVSKKNNKMQQAFPLCMEKKYIYGLYVQDNDFCDVKDISVTPSGQDLKLCQYPGVLPQGSTQISSTAAVATLQPHLPAHESTMIFESVDHPGPATDPSNFPFQRHL